MTLWIGQIVTVVLTVVYAEQFVITEEAQLMEALQLAFNCDTLVFVFPLLIESALSKAFSRTDIPVWFSWCFGDFWIICSKQISSNMFNLSETYIQTVYDQHVEAEILL